MAGKKGKGDARAQSKRGSGPGPTSSVDDLARRVAHNELSIQEEPLSLPPPAPGDAIQEQNLKAALDSPNIFVETTDNDGTPSTVEIEREVALLSPYVQREVLQQGNGVSSDRPIILPNKVTLEILELLLTYCRFHRASGRSDKERKIFDEKFIRLDTRRLCELTSAADALAMKPLVDLTSRALARLIEGKTPEQIRAQFQLPDDLTEEEKLEPVRNFGDDPKIRLLNRLYEKKRRELQKRRDEERKLIADGAAPTLSPEEKRRKDERSVEELLSFIENGGGGSAAATPRGTRKKKGRPARKPSPARPSEEAQHNSSTPMPSVKHIASTRDSPRLGRSQPSQPSTPTVRRLDSLEASQTPSTVSKPNLEDALGRLQTPVGSAPVRSGSDTQEQQSELGITQQNAEVKAAVEQRQPKASGPSNRHLSEDDDQEEDEADDSEASDTNDEEDSDEEDEADEAAADRWQIHRKELLPGSIGPLQGPITTLTSLAAFKARFQQPLAPDSMQSTAKEISQDTLSSPLPAPLQGPQSAQSASSIRAADMMESAAGAARPSNDWQLRAAAAEQASRASAVGLAEQNAHSLSNAATAALCSATSMERAAQQGADLGAASNAAAGSMPAAQQIEVEHDKYSNGIISRPEQRLFLHLQQGETAPVEALWEQSANIEAVHTALTAFLQKSGLSQYLSIEPTEAYPSEKRKQSADPPGHKAPVLDENGPSKQSGLHFSSQNGSAKRSTQHTAEANGSFSIQMHVHHRDNTVTLWP